MITDSALIAIAGLVAIVALLFLLITRFKWHVFMALLAPILLFAMIPGLDQRALIAAFERGFGSTIQISRPRLEGKTPCPWKSSRSSRSSRSS